MWKSDEITLSLRRPLGVTPSHDLGVFELRILSEALLQPSAAYGDLGETSERQPHDTTRRANRKGTRVRN